MESASSCAYVSLKSSSMTAVLPGLAAADSRRMEARFRLMVIILAEVANWDT